MANQSTAYYDLTPLYNCSWLNHNCSITNYTPSGSGNVDIESYIGSGWVELSASNYINSSFTHYIGIYVDGEYDPSFYSIMPSGQRNNIVIPPIPFKSSYRVNLVYAGTDGAIKIHISRHTR